MNNTWHIASTQYIYLDNVSFSSALFYGSLIQSSVISSPLCLVLLFQQLYFSSNWFFAIVSYFGFIASYSYFISSCSCFIDTFTHLSPQFSSVAQSCMTLCDVMVCTMPGFPVHHNSQSLLKLMSIKSVMQCNHLIICHPLLPPSIFPSIRVFSNESVLHIRWPKYRSFSFSIIPSKEIPGLISFKMNWLDLLAVQGTLESLLPTVQKHQLCSAQLSSQSNSHIQT